MTTWRSNTAERGLTLVELMIAMVLGLLLMAAMVQVYVGNRRNHNLQESLTGRQETARYAAQTIQLDAQMAGFRGCLRDAGFVTNTLNDDTDFLNNYAQHVTGFEANGANWSPALPAALAGAGPIAGNDVLTLRTVDDPGTFVTVDMANSSAAVVTRDDLVPDPFAAGDIALVADCGGAAIFQVTAFDPVTGTLSHAAGVGAPGNATVNLTRRYSAGAQIFTLRTTSYFIADSVNGTGPALWRQIGDAAPQELAEGVESLQVLYGEDDDGDLSPDAYRTADLVTDWADVVSIQVGMLVVGTPERVTDGEPRRFTVLDQVVPAAADDPLTDGRLRRVVTFTVALRNRLS